MCIRFLMIFWVAAMGCSSAYNQADNVKTEPPADAEAVAVVQQEPEPEKKKRKKRPEIVYTIFTLDNQETLQKFRDDYDIDQLNLILALNRIDSRHLRIKDSLIIPTEFTGDFMDYSVFPHYVEALDSIDKIIFFSYPAQAYGAYENGELVRWGPTSLGKRSTPTPTGLFFANWRAERTVSTINSDWILPFNVNIHNTRGISVHQYALPGYPASHACARLLEEDAKWFYSWSDSWVLDKKGQQVVVHGTPVIIYGDYKWEEPNLWKNLHIDSKSVKVTEDEIHGLFKEKSGEIMQKQHIRKQYHQPS